MKRFAAPGVPFAVSLSAFGTAHAEDNDVVELGYSNWSDALFTSHVAEYIIAGKMGHEVEKTRSCPEAAEQYVEENEELVNSWINGGM